MTETEQKAIIEKYNELVKNLECPMCHGKQFSLVDGFITPSLESKIGSATLGGRTLPCISIICNNCGYVSLHAAAKFGLMEKK